MGSGGSRSSTTSSIPPQFLPFFTGPQGLFPRAQEASRQVSAEPFGGERLAPVDPLSLESLQLQEALARSLGGVGQGVVDLGQRTLAGEFLSPESNPFLAATIRAATDPIFEQGAQQLGNLESQAIARGAFGGARSDLASQLLQGGVNRAAGDVAANIAFANLARERGLQAQAPGLISQGISLQQLPQTLLSQIGDVRRQLAQEPISEAIQIFNEAQLAPFAPLFPFANILQGTNLGTQTTSTFQPGAGGFGGGISGALGGAGTGLLAASALSGPLAPFLIGGALLGGLGGSL